MAEVSGAMDLRNAAVNNETSPNDQQRTVAFEKGQAAAIKNADIETVWETTSGKLMENLFARINTLSNKVVQVEDKVRRLSNVLELCGERQTRLFSMVSVKQRQTKKVPRKQKRCSTKNSTSDQEIMPHNTSSADVSPAPRSTLDSLVVCEENEIVADPGVSTDDEKEQECSTLYSEFLRSKGGDPRPQMQTDCPGIDDGYTDDISPDDVPKKRKRTEEDKEQTLVRSHADDNARLSFGKYRGATFRFVFTNDCNYVQWAIVKASRFDSRKERAPQNINFMRFVRYAQAQAKMTSQRIVDTAPLKQFSRPRGRPCMNGALCTRYGCYFVHPPERPPDCEQGEYCADKTCQKVHPSVPCKHGRRCILYSCYCVHPPGRRRKCELGWNCTDKSCRKLHPRRKN